MQLNSAECGYEMLSSRNINRVVAIVIIWIVAIVAVQARLLGLQVFSSNTFKKKACQQQRKPQDIPAKRGTIFDRNGIALAVDNLFYDIYGDPSQIDDPQMVDSVLCQIFQKPKGYYFKRINEAYGRFFVYLEWKVDISQATKVREHKLRGVGMTPIYNRFYPYGKIASTLIGCVGHDGEGLDGIEYFYNKELSGVSAQKIVFTDAFGRTYPLLCYSTGEPIPGNDLYLTIDIRLQQILQSELENAVSEHSADGAYGVFMNPKTGEILAMASVPNYDPNEYSEFPLNLRRNRVITDPYEPGSIFKLVTMSAALSEQVISTFDTIDTDHGRAKICGRIVKDVHSLGKIPVPDVIVHSSNVGITKIAQFLDKKKLYEYIRRFGFGTITGIDLPGENGGILRNVKEWWGTSMATIPMGYEIAATPLQLICAYGAVANKGRLMKPLAVKKCVGYDETVNWQRKPMVVRQVISKEIADTMTEMFRNVVIRGTARRANSKFIDIAGKTGTTHKQKEKAKGYHEQEYYSSFIGYAPSDNPEVVGLIMVDNPHKNGYYGGVVAAPVFRDVLEKAVSSGIFTLKTSRYLSLNQDGKNKIVSVPFLVRTTPEQAKELLKHRGLSAKFYGIGNIVVEQSPSPGRALKIGSIVVLHLQQMPVKSDKTSIVPDVRGLPLRNAIDKLAKADIKFRIEGFGIVTEQYPPPKTAVDTNGICVLICGSKDSEKFTQFTKSVSNNTFSMDSVNTVQPQ